jgi:hypothetical protein
MDLFEANLYLRRWTVSKTWLSEYGKIVPEGDFDVAVRRLHEEMASLIYIKPLDDSMANSRHFLYMLNKAWTEAGGEVKRYTQKVGNEEEWTGTMLSTKVHNWRLSWDEEVMFSSIKW